MTEETKPIGSERDWEAEAKGMGWNPEYEGEDSVDAKEFVRRKPIFDEMKKLRRKTKELESAVIAQKDMYAKQLVKEKEQILNQLKQQKIEAITNGDAEAVVKLEERIDQVKSAPLTNEPPKEFAPFKEANSWYTEDEDMTVWADSLGVKLASQGKSVSEVYDIISKRVREIFPHKFKNENRDKAGNVESSSPKGGNEDLVAMPKDHKVIAETFWKAGAYGTVSRKDALKRYSDDYLNKFGSW